MNLHLPQCLHKGLRLAANARRRNNEKALNILLLPYLVDIFSVFMMFVDADLYGKARKARLMKSYVHSFRNKHPCLQPQVDEDPAIIFDDDALIEIVISGQTTLKTLTGQEFDAEPTTFAMMALTEGNPEEDLKDYAIIDSGCSGSMTGDKDKLSDFKEFKGGYVAFGNDSKGGRISGKGTIKTSCLDFEKVSYVEELNSHLLMEDLGILRAPRKNDVYSLDLKNIIPSGGVTCLVAKATNDEVVLWHRRLGHVNLKNINKLVQGNLVRGLPSKTFKIDHSVSCMLIKGIQAAASCKKVKKELSENL
ncbi:ribonuclease H-like domain-containing protein [Tanacetum coccineum]